MNTAVARQQDNTTAITPMQLLEVAVTQGAETERLSHLMDLQERWEARQAKKAYDEAMAAFKADPPVLVKDREVDYTTQKGRTHYTHASHQQVMTKIGEALSKHGLSHSFSMEQKPIGNDSMHIVVACKISHIAGHCETTRLFASADTSGGKNAIQAVGSTVTYLQRYTLMAATGLSAGDHDDDGQSAGRPMYSEDERYLIAAAMAWKHRESLDVVTENLDNYEQDKNPDWLSCAAEALYEIPEDDWGHIWVAPTKIQKAGFPAPLSIENRNILTSTEFREIAKPYIAAAHEAGTWGNL